MAQAAPRGRIGLDEVAVLALFGWWVVSRSLAPLRRIASDVRQRDERAMAPLPTDRLPETRPRHTRGSG